MKNIKDLEVIRDLMDELISDMDYKGEDFDERLGKHAKAMGEMSDPMDMKKPSMKMGAEEMGEDKPSIEIEIEKKPMGMMEDEEDEDEDPELKLKKRIMMMRG